MQLASERPAHLVPLMAQPRAQPAPGRVVRLVRRQQLAAASGLEAGSAVVLGSAAVSDWVVASARAPDWLKAAASAARAWAVGSAKRLPRRDSASACPRG